jgi:hypothetical protein
VNGQQKMAFLHPCYEAEACSHRRYAILRQTDRVAVSVIVTLNIGLE